MARLAALGLFLVLGLPLAASVESQGTIEFSPPALAVGDMTAELSEGAYFAGFRSGPQGGAALRVETLEADLKIVDTMADFLFLGQDQTCVPKCDSVTRQETQLDASTTSFEVQETLENFTLVLNPKQRFSASIQAAEIRQDLNHPAITSYSWGSSLEPFPQGSISPPNAYNLQADGQVHHATPSATNVDYSGQTFLYVSGADLRLTNATGTHPIRTGQWRELLQEDPAGAGARVYRYHHVALIGNFTGKTAMSYEGPYGHLLAPSLHLHNVSKLAIPLTQAQVDLPGRRYESQGEPYLELAGRMDVLLPERSAPSDTGRVRASVAGEIFSISENGNLVRAFPPQLAAATAGGLGLLAVAYLVVSWLRRGGVYVAVRALEWKLFTFVPFAAKLDLAKVLAHPVRQGIMGMLSGTHAMRNLADLRREVATAYGISTIAAYLHLRTLWRANHLTVVRLGSRHFIGPNSGGMGPKEQRVAASLLHRPEALESARFICAHPGSTQGEVVAHVQATSSQAGAPISRGVALKWVRRLESVKLTPTHLVRAFGASMNRHVDPADVRQEPVALVVRCPDSADARVIRYEPTDILYDVVRAFVERRGDLGTALTELTRLQVLRRGAQASSGAANKT